MSEPFARDFLGWDRPALPEAAGRLLERGNEGSVVDLSGIVAVVPGSRAGRRLKELLVEGAAGRGRPLRPPRVVTIGALPELLHRPVAPPPPRLRARLAWAAELAALPADHLEPLLPSPPEKGDLSAWFGLARRVESLHRELGGELLSFADVAGRCGSGGSFDDGPRWRVLAAVQERVLERLRNAGWEDVDDARRAALREQRVRFEGELWLIGVSELSRTAKRMLSALPGPIRVLIHAPETEAEAFHPDGTLRVEAWVRRPLDPGPSFHVEGGPVDQADRCLRFLAGLGGEYGPDEIVVGAPDAEVVPALSQRLDLCDIPNREAEGRPLPVTAPYLLLRAIADHLREGRPATLAELVRHPHLDAWFDEAGIDVGSVIRSLDRYREEALPSRAAAEPLPGRPESGHRRRAEEARRRVEELIGGWRRERPLAQWSLELVGLLQAIYGQRVLEEERREDYEIETFAREVRRVLDEVEEPPEGDPVLPGHLALQLLLGELDETAVPPPAGDPSVEILGWLELHLDDAPVLLLTGVNDGSLPRSDASHPFLPDGMRTALDVPDQRARRARDAYRLTAILRSRDRVLLTAGRRTARGDPLRPSPLVLQGAPSEAAARILRHYGEAGDPGESEPVGRPKEVAVEPVSEAAASGGNGAEPIAPPLDRHLPPPEPPLRIRVTAFRLLLEDPYRWLLVEQAGSAWIEDERRELDPMAFGGLAHDVLEELGRDLRTEARAGRLAEGLVSCLEARVRERYGTRLLPAVRVQVAQLGTRLEALADVEARERARGWETVAVEVGVPEEGVPFQVDGDTVYLRGRVDRIDRHPELGWRLLDYKTSERPQKPDAQHRRGRERRWVDLQLPLYRHLASRLELEGERLRAELPGPEAGLGLGYYNLPRALDRIGVEMAAWTFDDLTSADEAARAALRPLLAGEPIAPDPGAPAIRPEDALAPLLGQGILSGDGSDDAEAGAEGGADGDA